GPGGSIRPDTFTTIFIHTPGDPYWTSWGIARDNFYNVTGTPTSWFDGVTGLVGAYTNNIQMYNWYMSAYDARRAVATDVTIDVGAVSLGGQSYRVTAMVCLEAGAPTRTMRIYNVRVLDNYPLTPADQRNCVMEGGDTTDITLNAQECQLVHQNYTFDAVSWSRPDDIKVMFWAQQPFSSAPAEVFQSAVMTWPFPPPPATDPVEPDPMTFFLPPSGGSTSQVVMIATTATGGLPPIEYYFEFVTGGAGGDSSGWQTMTAYTDSGLETNAPYTYRVKARDSDTPPSETAYSADGATATRIETPTGLVFGAVASDSIELNASGTFTNLTVGSSGMYFDCTTPGGDAGINEWLQITTDTATGLSADAMYEFQVRARNQIGVMTPYSGTASKATLANVPGAPILTVLDCTSLDIDIDANGNPAITTYAVLCTDTSPHDATWDGMYVDATGNPSASPVYQTATDWDTTAAVGLTEQYSYTFDANAKNQEGVETAAGPTSQATTAGGTYAGDTTECASTGCVDVGASCNTHGLEGEFCLPIGSGGARVPGDNVEPRFCGVNKLLLDFSLATDAASLTVDVSCVDNQGLPVSYTGVVTNSQFDADTVQLDLSEKLPNDLGPSCCTLTFSGSAAGQISVASVPGDVSRDLSVTTSDKSLIKPKIGVSLIDLPSADANFWFDVDCGGTITVSDKSLIKPKIGTEGSIATCP
ncbi:MAG: fibronectin type III domain-containing protein, partial [Planctomycetota bacterium]